MVIAWFFTVCALVMILIGAAPTQWIRQDDEPTCNGIDILGDKE